MKPMPPKLRKELSKDSYYKKCCLTKSNENIEWHHAWIYAGKQINEKWAIMPVCKEKHSAYKDSDSIHNCLITRQIVKYLSLLRINLDYLCKKFPRIDWKQEFKYLESIYKKNKINFPKL